MVLREFDLVIFPGSEIYDPVLHTTRVSRAFPSLPLHDGHGNGTSSTCMLSTNTNTRSLQQGWPSIAEEVTRDDTDILPLSGEIEASGPSGSHRNTYKGHRSTGLT